MNQKAEHPLVVRERTWFENLDATRFLGFFHVFLAHCFIAGSTEIKESSPFIFITAHLKSGFLGLDYFFVLSAFLLTWLALEEVQKTGRFHPIKFLIRRGLRLWPLYFMLIGLVYSAAACIPEIDSLPPIRVFLLFYANLWMAEHGQEFLFMLVFFWSVSVEEQFYLFWAILIRGSEKLIPWACVMMICASLIFRYAFYDQNNTLSFHTLSILGNFGTGGLAAWLAFRLDSFKHRMINLSRNLIYLVYGILLVLTVFYFRLFSGTVGIVVEKQVFALLFAIIILEQCFSKQSFIKFGRFKLLGYLGRISLGLYCFHGLVLTIAASWLTENGYAQTTGQVYLINPLLILSATTLLAILSYELFEKRIHRLRRNFY
jgi:peptidoglycan/LPS O-acetylase OafA/YrhL